MNAVATVSAHEMNKHIMLKNLFAGTKYGAILFGGTKYGTVVALDVYRLSLNQ
jgi:hypothetical protein